MSVRSGCKFAIKKLLERCAAAFGYLLIVRVTKSMLRCSKVHTKNFFMVKVLSRNVLLVKLNVCYRKVNRALRCGLDYLLIVRFTKSMLRCSKVQTKNFSMEMVLLVKSVW
jgi:hypothetical protein